MATNDWKPGHPMTNEQAAVVVERMAEQFKRYPPAPPQHRMTQENWQENVYALNLAVAALKSRE